MQKPRECHKLTSDNSIINVKKPVHDPFKFIVVLVVVIVLLLILLQPNFVEEFSLKY